jgi:proline iminopeptidase
MYSNQEADAQIAFVRICARFFSNGAWLEEDQLLRNANKLAGIPAVLAHGRHDDAALPWHQNWAIGATLRA